MKRSMVVATTLLAAGAPFAQTVRFDTDSVGSPPTGWTCGVTGRGNPRWTVEADASAPSPPNVLVQSGSGTFPWCVRDDSTVVDGFVEVRIKPIKGREDQAGLAYCRARCGWRLEQSRQRHGVRRFRLRSG